MDRQKIKRTLIVVGATSVAVGGVVVAVGLRKKYNVKIEEARQAGVTDWIIDMNGKDLIVMALPSQFADRVWDIFGEVPGMLTDYESRYPTMTQ